MLKNVRLSSLADKLYGGEKEVKEKPKASRKEKKGGGRIKSKKRGK